MDKKPKLGSNPLEWKPMDKVAYVEAKPEGEAVLQEVVMHYQKQKIRKWKQATKKTRAANLRKIQRRIDENRRILNRSITNDSEKG